MDFRLRRKLAAALKKRFPLEDYDLISIAGGIQDLLAEEWQEFILKQFELSRKLHNSSVIILIQHEDCGAYGGSTSFGGFEQEFSFQEQQLQKAAALLKERFPKTSCERYLVRLSGQVIEVKDEGIAS
jgi:hypothetical protein